MRCSRFVAVLSVLVLAAAPAVAAPAGVPGVDSAGAVETETDARTFADRVAAQDADTVAAELVEGAIAADEALSDDEAVELATALVDSAAAFAETEPFATQTQNPVATDEVTYQAYARVFSDPHGCFVHGDELPPEGAPISPYAKGNGCQVDYLTYEETIEGLKFLERRFGDLIQVIRLDEAYDDPDMRSAGIPRIGAIEDGDAHAFGRDRSPLYLVKVTDRNSDIPESERLHFTYSGAIHGDERAGHEGGVRAMEDLVTWAACEMDDERAAGTPACELEGVDADGQEIVESDTDRPVPTAGEVLRETVNYYFMANPDGWRSGQKRTPTEFRDGNPNVNYRPGASFWRHNAHGIDLNRDWPSVGYTLKSHQPWSEPETRAFGEVLSDIRDRTADGHFAAGIDLHGMLTASAFSYTLLGADQRDFRKNEITVETSLRTYEDQTARLRWSPYIGDSTGDGQQDQEAAIIPVADEWGTIYDTIGYTVTGALGFWMDDSRIGLGGVGINNEMALSNIVPNSIYEPALNQTHIDGNKGLIYSQIAALMFEEDVMFEPGGQVAYVENPLRITDEGFERAENPGLPSQNDIDVFLPCQGELAQQLPGNCGPGEFSTDGSTMTYTFEVLGPDEGVWNGGLTARSTTPQQDGGPLHLAAGVTLERFDEGADEWVEKEDLNRTAVTHNDPEPGLWRVTFGAAPHNPRRLEISFDRDFAEADPGQAPIDASSMDFYTELNDYVPEGRELTAVDVTDVIGGPGQLRDYDTLIVTNNLGDPEYLTDELGLAPGQVRTYFDKLAGFAADGGNLVLTDGAVRSLAEMDLVDADDVVVDGGLAGFYGFRTAPDELTYEDPETYPLAAGVDLPGAAERTEGNRQAVEPTTLGYSPSGRSHARMPFHGIDRDAWEALCDRDEPTHCTTATTQQDGDVTSIGEVALGEGTVRIVGSLLPDPLRQEDDTADNRFGLGSYAITYTAYIVFENLIDYERP